jgi:phytoene dehydrogenase-like protein
VRLDSLRSVVRVAVVGASFAGMAAAVRLAKLGHAVTLHERDAELGGRLRPIRHEGFVWDAGPTTLTLPAVVRDLFRKSGRPLERVLELQPVRPGRRHLFADGTGLDLPMGARLDQVDAITAVFDGPTADVWAGYVDHLAPMWDILRRRTLEEPFDGRDSIPDAEWKVLRPRQSLRRAFSRHGRRIRDERLAAMLFDRHRLAGQDPRALPAWFGVIEYVERSFGRWRVDGGMQALVRGLEQRLGERSVDVRTESAVEDAVVEDGEVRGIVRADGFTEPAEVVVWAAPRPPAAMVARRQLGPAIPAARTYLGLRGDVPALPAETFVHETPLAVIRTGGEAPEGQHAWSIEHQLDSEDILVSLARRGVDVRHQVVSRLDRSPSEIVGARGASPAGVAWSGWRTAFQRERPGQSVPGLFRLGPDVHPGPGLIPAGLGAAQVATLVGKA